MTKELLSNCCSASVKVIGAVTKHYHCLCCNEACDLEEEEINEFTGKPRNLQADDLLGNINLI